MDYQDQLQSIHWKIKRNHILERDDFSCKKCGCKRSEFLGLSKKYGIKTYEELINNNIAISLSKNGNYVVVKDRNSGIVNKCRYTSGDFKEIILEKLKFALKKEEDELSKLICFIEDIKELDNQVDLNIHHKYYITGKYAWEYNDEALITLCRKCHQYEHQNNEIFVYNDSMALQYKAEICNKCSGSGYLPQFYYFENGTCFNCNGHGVIF